MKVATPPGTVDFLLHFNKAAKCLDRHEAQNELEKAVTASPVISGALANSLLRNGDLQAAIDLYGEVINAANVDPKVKALSLNDIGMAFSKSGNRDFAIKCFRDAVHLLKTSPEIWYNLGLAEAWGGNWEAKIKCVERALRLKPNFHDAHFSRATSLLTIGNFKDGFREYEARWKARLTKPDLGLPDLQYLHEATNKSVLVYAEQGAGDTLQMLRYLPLLRRTADKVFIAVQPGLMDLAVFSQLADGVFNADSLLAMDRKAFDCCIPFMSLPRLLRTESAETIPPAPYLPTPEPAKLDEKAAFRVGLVWAGSADHTDDKWRSMAFKHFESVLNLEGVHFYSLQVGCRRIDGMFSEQLRQLTPKTYLDTAKMLMALDLVISVDTSVVHLAGALGRPCWVLVPYCPDWRWGLGTENCAWYKSITLFRQPQPNDWDTPIVNIINRLPNLIAAKHYGRA